VSTTEATERWTILRLLNWTTDHFKKRGSSSPRLDAEVLLAHACQCTRISLYTQFDVEPASPVRDAFRALVKQRGDGVPVAYLVGQKEFYSIPLAVDSRVLIPRPETEHVVSEVLDIAKVMIGSSTATRGTANDAGDSAKPIELKIADVGTGSGAIAIAIAKHQPKAQLIAIDRSADALAIARANIERHQLTARIQCVEGNLLEPVPPSHLPLDIVASNPPYVRQDEWNQLPRDVRDHEPTMALVGGTNGTEIIEQLILQAHQALRPGGWLVFELGPAIAASCQALLQSWANVRLVKDLANLPRVLVAQRL
jgi:release factor glutamine methyltransferase